MSKTDGKQSTDDMSIEDMTKSDALQEIGRIAGFRGFSRTQLRKRDMNSVFWYLTGETIAHWQHFDTQRSPTYVLMRRALADACDIEYIDSWTDTRPFQRDELREIVREMRLSDDHRQHSSDDG